MNTQMHFNNWNYVWHFEFLCSLDQVTRQRFWKFQIIVTTYKMPRQFYLDLDLLTAWELILFKDMEQKSCIHIIHNCGATNARKEKQDVPSRQGIKSGYANYTVFGQTCKSTNISFLFSYLSCNFRNIEFLKESSMSILAANPFCQDILRKISKIE